MIAVERERGKNKGGVKKKMQNIVVMSMLVIIHEIATHEVASPTLILNI